MKKFIFVALICFCFGLNIFAQTKIKVLKYEAPRDSRAVFAVGLKGEFIVIVKIDQNGKAISANSGNIRPLLKQVLEETAGKWLFSINKNLQERESKIFFDYITKTNNFKKTSDNPPKITNKFKKPNRLIITAEIYPKTSVY